MNKVCWLFLVSLYQPGHAGAHEVQRALASRGVSPRSPPRVVLSRNEFCSRAAWDPAILNPGHGLQELVHRLSRPG